MLQHLSIRAFALVESVELDMGSGLTVLIGETGAGKSILIDALAIALGERASAEAVRTGAKKAVIEATFRSDIPGVAELIAANDLDTDPDELVIRREISAAGTSRCFVNDTPTTTAVVRELGSILMDFHGQHDTHGLLSVPRHREILDASAGTAELLRSMQSSWTDLVTAERELQVLQQRSQSADEDRARLDFIRQEIAAISPVEGEDEQIAADLLRAEASEHVIATAAAARELLYSGDVAAYDQILQARDRVRELLKYDPSLQATLDDLESALTACKEAAGSVAPLAEAEDFSPERLEDLRQRQVLLQRLIRKHGSLSSALAVLEKTEIELATLENLDEVIQHAKRSVDNIKASARKIAKSLTALRGKQAQPLAKGITTSLATMGMPSSIVTVAITPADLGPFGADHVEFLFSANAGEEARPLAKVASGGELSRFMLALKKTVAEQNSVGTMVFDEIDTGISGRIARHVGEVMKDLAQQHQVLCITHLPQIASLADKMIRVIKTDDGKTSTVSAEEIEGEDIVVEIAKLLSGATISDAALDGARELMAASAPRRGRK